MEIFSKQWRVNHLLNISCQYKIPSPRDPCSPVYKFVKPNSLSSNIFANNFEISSSWNRVLENGQNWFNPRGNWLPCQILYHPWPVVYSGALTLCQLLKSSSYMYLYQRHDSLKITSCTAFVLQKREAVVVRARRAAVRPRLQPKYLACYKSSRLCLGDRWLKLWKHQAETRVCSRFRKGKGGILGHEGLTKWQSIHLIKRFRGIGGKPEIWGALKTQALTHVHILAEDRKRKRFISMNWIWNLFVGWW